MEVKKLIFGNWKKIIVVIISLYLGMSLLTATYNPLNWFKTKYAIEIYVTKDGDIASINARKSGIFREAGKDFTEWINNLGVSGERHTFTARLRVYKEHQFEERGPENITMVTKEVTAITGRRGYAVKRGHIKIYPALESATTYRIEAKVWLDDLMIHMKDIRYVTPSAAGGVA